MGTQSHVNHNQSFEEAPQGWCNRIDRSTGRRVTDVNSGMIASFPTPANTDSQIFPADSCKHGGETRKYVQDTVAPSTHVKRQQHIHTSLLCMLFGQLKAVPTRGEAVEPSG